MDKGFALLSSLLVLVLLVTMALAMLTLSSLQLRSSQGANAHEQASDHARLALAHAIAELQQYTGADQRVTANAAILEKEGESLANRSWLGVWSTSHEHDGRQWPLIGKQEIGTSANDASSSNPYGREGVLVDLRSSLPEYSGGKWRDQRHLAWLVSGAGDRGAVDEVLSMDDDSVVEILGRGTLGSEGDGVSEANYQRGRVLVKKVGVLDRGAYAWYISDNSLKASIVPRGGSGDDGGAYHFEATAQANPAYVGNSSLPYRHYRQKAMGVRDRLVSYGSAELVGKGESGVGDDLRKALAANYHDFTTDSSGLFTDSLLSGMRYDLTPLLFANKGASVVDFVHPETGELFSSSYPIIAGASHAVMGPSLAALRDWGQHRYSEGGGEVKAAETLFAKEAVRMRPADNWAFGVSDGACSDASHWASGAAKIHPVMTDVRWHYYFSHHENRVRTHIIPRVCLWNPYNRDLEIPDLSVLLPNPFHQVEHGIHFFPEDEHVAALKANYADEPDHPFSKWVQKSGYVGGDVYKIKLNPFPQTRYLAFVLKGTLLRAGECHVFSPQVTNPSEMSAGVGIQKYQSEDVFLNVLSSAAPQGGGHFYFDHRVDKNYTIQTSSGRAESDLTAEQISEIDWSQIKDYQPEISMSSVGRVESFPFILKSGVASTLTELYTSADYVTLQLINNAAGGVHATKSFAIQGIHWGSANQTDNSFGRLQTFQENPLKDAADTHQVGAKMLWLDESFNEGNLAPYRHGTNSNKESRWASDHMAYHPCLVANWNVRAQLVSRSPVSQCGRKYYLNSTGPWIQQYVPLSPQDGNDMPILNEEGTALIKSPFGLSVMFAQEPKVILFDLPSEDAGVLSLAGLRHAMLSPYSWNPSYLVGHSLRDLHAPADSTAYEVSVADYDGSLFSTRWDYLLGAGESGEESLDHGAFTTMSDSQGLMQLGGEKSVSSPDEEILAYDIAYEVNYYLWDRFFISSMLLDDSGEEFRREASVSEMLANNGYQFNRHGERSMQSVQAELHGAGGVNRAFWSNAEFLKNSAAFNVNSTSVAAWTAFLSGALGVARPMLDGESGADVLSFARYREPKALVTTEQAHPDRAGGWTGARSMSADEVRALAESVVEEVRLRGPFISIADFVNRRLSDELDPTSRMGVLDSAIDNAGLNAGFVENAQYRSKTVNEGSDPASKDHNLEDFSMGYRYDDNGQWVSSQPTSQAWGLPGYLTQSDVLEPIASSLTSRGDTFTIRCYGEARISGVEGSDEATMVRVWCEAIVERTPSYIDATANTPSDAAQRLDHRSGEYLEGELSELNKALGRRYVIKSFRWLGRDEV